MHKKQLLQNYRPLIYIYKYSNFCVFWLVVHY